MSGAKLSFTSKGHKTELRSRSIDPVMNRPHMSNRSRKMAMVVPKIGPKLDAPVIQGPS